MDFFDKLGKKATQTYKDAAEKTGKLAKEAKLKMLMNDNKEKIQELYEQIGKKVYEKHIREENISIKEELLEECSKIDVLSDEIEAARMDILQLKDRRQCSNCYCEIDKEDNFCPNCGVKQEKEPEEEIEEVKEVEVIEKEPEEKEEDQIEGEE